MSRKFCSSPFLSIDCNSLLGYLFLHHDKKLLHSLEIHTSYDKAFEESEDSTFQELIIFIHTLRALLSTSFVFYPPSLSPSTSVFSPPTSSLSISLCHLYLLPLLFSLHRLHLFPLLSAIFISFHFFLSLAIIAASSKLCFLTYHASFPQISLSCVFLAFFCWTPEAFVVQLRLLPPSRVFDECDHDYSTFGLIRRLLNVSFLRSCADLCRSWLSLLASRALSSAYAFYFVHFRPCFTAACQNTSYEIFYFIPITHKNLLARSSYLVMRTMNDE